MFPTLNDLSVFEHEDLVGALNGREPMRNHEGGATRAQRSEPVPNMLLGFRVQARRRLVQEQDLGVGENRARDRNALPLASRQAHAAFTHHRLVLVREAFNELVTVGHACHRPDLPSRGTRLCERDVVDDGTVEQEIVLEYDAQVAPVVAQANLCQVMARHEDPATLRLTERHDQRDQGALSRPARSHQSRGRALPCDEAHALENGDSLAILEPDILESDVAIQRREGSQHVIPGVLGWHAHDLADAVEPGERLADLRAD